MISAIHTGLQRTENRSPTTYAPGKRIYNVWRIDRATYWTKRTVPRVLNDANTNTTIVYPPNVYFILFYLTVRRRSPVRRAAPLNSPFTRARVVRNTNSRTSGLTVAVSRRIFNLPLLFRRIFNLPLMIRVAFSIYR